MKPIKEMNIGELAAYVCTYLKTNGVECVLTGGACVSIYSDNKYLSFDIDFIDRSDTKRKIIKELLSIIGFIEHNRYFVKTNIKFFIEFPSGPLTVGNEKIEIVNEIEFETGKLFLLTPTDCVKDRLAAFFYWDDLQSLEQALLITKTVPVNLKEIETWSINERQHEKFNLFKSKIEKK